MGGILEKLQNIAEAHKAITTTGDDIMMIVSVEDFADIKGQIDSLGGEPLHKFEVEGNTDLVSISVSGLHIYFITQECLVQYFLANP